MGRDIIREKVIIQGQPYVDEPVFAQPKATPKLQRVVQRALLSRVVVDMKPAKSPLHLPEPVTADQTHTGPVPQQIGHERIRLQWMKPDGKGGLRPR